jgi:hypothetical protein
MFIIVVRHYHEIRVNYGTCKFSHTVPGPYIQDKFVLKTGGHKQSHFLSYFSKFSIHDSQTVSQNIM